MATTAEAMTTPKTLEYLPVGLFGSTMGLTGLSVAWRQANKILGMPLWRSETIAVMAVVVFLALLAAYCVKIICAPGKVLAEFHHPIAGNLFGTFLKIRCSTRPQRT